MHSPGDHLPLSTAPAPHSAPPPRNGSLSDRVRSLRLADRTTQGNVRGTLVPWTLAALALLAALAFGYRTYRLPSAENTTPETERLKELLASAGGKDASAEDLDKIRKILASRGGKVSADVAASGEVVLESKGYVIPIHSIQLSPQVGGEIIWLDPNFQEGAVYKKGDRLAEIDPVIFQAQVRNAEAALHVAEVNRQQVESGSTLKDIAAAKAQLQSLEAKLEVSRIDERTKLLSGIGSSRDEREKATAQVKADEAAVASQKATVARWEISLEEQRLVTRNQVESAQANLDQARKQLKNCTITAPTTGIVLTKKAELGGYVNPLAFGAAGYLCEMADLSKVEIELSVQERDFAKVQPPRGGDYQICTIVPEAFQRDERFRKLHPNGYEGYVSRVMPVADRAKGAITVRVRVRVPDDEAGFYLKPDMGVIVSFKSQSTQNVERD
jgi:multidrug efflux pump subunit AcrA (membrane-fusion protein)